MKRLITTPLFLALFLLSASWPAHAGVVNFATVRGTVAEVYPDCSTCNLSVPHGCYVVVNASDPIAVHLPVQPNGDDCNNLVEEDCIEMTGSVVDLVVSGWPPPPVDRVQLEAASWVYAANLCAE